MHNSSEQAAGTDAVALPSYTIEAGRAPHVERTTWLGEGDFCSCYLVNSRYVFRFAKHATASAAMRVERCLLPILGDHLTTVEPPRLEFAGRRTDTGHALIGYRCLPGEQLEAALLERLPPASRDALIAQMAAAARQLHDLPLQLISGCALPTLDPLTHLGSSIEHARAALWPQLSQPVTQHYESLLTRYKAEPELHMYQPALLHGDLSPEHVLADTEPPRLTGIIDFGDACIGDPAWDLVYIYEDYGPHTLSAFLERYDPPNAELLERKVHLYQQLNNVAYCLSVLTSGDGEQLREALTTLAEQAVAVAS